MIKLDKNIPLLRDPRGSAVKYPWDEMEVGDSFFSPGRGAVGQGTIHGRRHGRRYTSRQVEENGVPGVRMWRVR
jgi:hypothetical protein